MICAKQELRTAELFLDGFPISRRDQSNFKVVL